MELSQWVGCAILLVEAAMAHWLDTRMAKNPEGHNPKYWRKHFGGPQGQAESKTAEVRPPWYQSTLFWSSFSLAITCVCTVVAAMTKNLLWLLPVAWLFAAIAVWELVRCLVRSQRRAWVLTLVGAILIAILLFKLAINLKRPEKSTLSVRSYPSNLDYEGKTIFGIKWEAGFKDVRLILSTPETQIQDVDLTIKLAEDGMVIVDVQQNTKIKGVYFTPPDIPDATFPLTVGGATATISTRDMMDLNGPLPPAMYGNRFELFCPRLPQATQLRLAMAISVKAPQHLHVFGTYQKVTEDGIKLIKVDEIVKVTPPS